MITGEDRFKLHFYGTMNDEKRVRIDQGMGGAGSDNLCTLCDCTREEAKTRATGYRITRTYQVNMDRYNDR